MQLCRRWPRFPPFAAADSVLMLDTGTYFASLLFAHLVFSQESPHSQSSEAQENAHQKIRQNMLQTSAPPHSMTQKRPTAVILSYIQMSGGKTLRTC